MKVARVIFWSLMSLPIAGLFVLWVWGVVANVSQTGFGR